MPRKIAFPERLKKFREKLGLSHEDLARELSTTTASITRWEAGATKPSEFMARALEAKGFGAIKEFDTNKDSLSR
ncbi:MAG: helix-turn-helix transcriptional regulator, partial [Pseudomonadota bacterium]|nr:helix-turn-helix transcriptional regulator [Pseudomonadota bacterium]